MLMLRRGWGMWQRRQGSASLQARKQGRGSGGPTDHTVESEL